ncbi:MAG: ester cyclase, partial [Dehalococcoidales bacterium]|nr:ester cyclase [Dehalococcoidales bacterium]
GTGDGSKLLEIEDPDIVIHMMSFPDIKGSANHVAAIQGIVANNPGITHEWYDLVATGDIGACRWVEKLKIGDKDVSYQGAYFLRVKNGKIVEAWLISDMLTYFLAAGIVQYATPAGK